MAGPPTIAGCLLEVLSKRLASEVEDRIINGTSESEEGPMGILQGHNGVLTIDAKDFSNTATFDNVEVENYYHQVLEDTPSVSIDFKITSWPELKEGEYVFLGADGQLNTIMFCIEKKRVLPKYRMIRED